MVLLLAAVVVGAGCSGDDLGSDAGRVLVGSSLEVAVDDGWEAVEVGDAIPDGARVRTGEGEARLELRDGEVWLAPGSMAVVSREVVDAIRGDLLVLSAGRLAARSGDTDIAGRSTFRLTPGITPLLRVYEGSADVQRPGEERTLAARREIGLAATRLATQSSPLSYDPADPWDRRLLPTAVAFDGEVARLARGIDRQHGTEPQAAEFYETFSAVSAETIPVLVSVSRRVLSDDRFGPPSDALVTLFVAEAVAAAGEQTLAEAAREVTRWRQRGARWGLVALELDISTSALAVAVNLGQERRLAVEQEAVPEPVEPASADPASADAAPPAPTTTPAPTAPSTTSPQPAPTQGAASSPPPPPPPPTSTSPSPPSPPAQPSPPDAQVPLPEPSPPPPTLSSPVDAAAKVVEDVVGGITDTSGSLLGD